MSESRAQRQAALEERRRRIAELREARSRRQEDTARVQASATANLDDFVTGLLNEPSPVPVAEEEEADVETQTSSQQQEAAATTPESGSATGAAAETPAAAPVAVAPVPAPKQVETFTIGTQTDDIEEEPAIVEDEDEEELEEKDEQTEAPTATAMIQPKVLSPQELEKEVTAPQFTTFLNTASKNVERMLTAADIWQKASDPLDASSAHGSTTEPGQEDTQKFLTDRVVFEVDKWTSGRDITDIDWQSRELFLSTYGSRSAKTVINTATTRASSTPSDSLTPRSGELQSDGLVALWSLMLPPNRPEHILTCASPVQSGRFHPTERNLVVGGCASGQVVVWDVRAGKLPVQTSASVVGGSSGGHVHPVCQMEVLDGGAGFVTGSTDGKVNFWSLSNLLEPAESLQLGDSLSSLAVAPDSGGATVVFGDDTGALHASVGHPRRRVRKFEQGHYGMVTALSMQSSSAQHKSKTSTLVKGFWRDSAGLVLSAGVDWTVQLWAPAYTESAPLTTWVSHSYEYMSDVRWSPTHPSLFCTASTNGRIGLWNLGTSLEEPVCQITTTQPSINKIKWSSDGRRLAVAAEDKLEVLTWTEETLRKDKAEEDGKAMMNSFLSRGWIQNRQ